MLAVSAALLLFRQNTVKHQKLLITFNAVFTRLCSSVPQSQIVTSPILTNAENKQKETKSHFLTPSEDFKLHGSLTDKTIPLDSIFISRSR